MWLILEYSSNLVRERALGVIADYEEGDKPIFLWMTFTTPHVPLQSPDKYMDMYEGEVTGARQKYLG